MPGGLILEKERSFFPFDSFAAPERLALMRAHRGPPVQYDHFLESSEIVNLKRMFAEGEKDVKPTGPICTRYRHSREMDHLIRRLGEILPESVLFDTSLFFKTDYPHVLHADAPKDPQRVPSKGILIPLDFEGESEPRPFDMSFFVFHQRWYDFPVKLFRGEREKSSPHNRPLFDYEGLEDLGKGPAISGELREKWFSHLAGDWLEGLSIERQFDWKIGSIIVFDSFQIHCANDFRRRGIRSKLGLSLFTGHPAPLPHSSSGGDLKKEGR